MEKMLMAKWRTLQEENEEIGNQASEGKLHDPTLLKSSTTSTPEIPEDVSSGKTLQRSRIPFGGNHRRTAMWDLMVNPSKRSLLAGRLISKGILLSIDKIRKIFLWGGGGDERKINWVKWEKICDKKEEGGLGVKDLRKFNLALMGKWWGRLAKIKEGLWKNVVKERYGEGENHWLDWVKGNRGVGSIWWRDVCCLDSLDGERGWWLTEGVRIRMGEGKGLAFDGIIGVGKGGEVNEAKTYQRIWNPSLPSKILAFNWQLLLDRIPTKVNLLRRGVIKDMTKAKCALCNEEEEKDSTHLFLNCKIVRWVWMACSKWWGTNIMMNRDCWNTFQLIGKGIKGSNIREGMDCIWKTIVWSMWIARNQKIFHNKEDKEINLGKLFELIQMRSFLWIKATKDMHYYYQEKLEEKDNELQKLKRTTPMEQEDKTDLCSFNKIKEEVTESIETGKEQED
ncbi:hypothetical protein SLEP1_g44538 [Rubroshorea leprosula]|uniref:Reverse transcriptase zinc-binding domain-containing protein n=1 Tax=Rubroshorea leprosula TaxID=152421 RepID=A0AAV5LI27_9ROSI|nr:hypothetical protein SLEP1_g44538 [Rubroshorea leprosula]